MGREGGGGGRGGEGEDRQREGQVQERAEGVEDADGRHEEREQGGKCL